jgi:hypothetical protein
VRSRTDCWTVWNASSFSRATPAGKVNAQIELKTTNLFIVMLLVVLELVVVLTPAKASSCQAFDPFAAVAASESAMAGPAVCQLGRRSGESSL